MNNDKSLVTTIHATIYQGEHNADTLIFLLPLAYEGRRLSDSNVLLRYILPNGVGKSENLEMDLEPYNEDYYIYRLGVASRFTSQEGEVELWLTAIDMYDNVILKTSSINVEISPSKDVTDFMSNEDLNQLDLLAAKVEELENTKADNILFNPDNSTIQLMSNGVPIGDAVFVSASNTGGTCVGIANVEIISGDLVVTLTDGTIKNLGNVVGADGAVYVPHVSANKVLTFTIENEIGVIPDPIDLNPFDEWSSMDGSTVETTYVWEKM